MYYDFEYYSGRHLLHPTKPTKPVISRNPTAVEARAWAEALEEYERELKGYEEDKVWHQNRSSTLMKEFQDNLKKDYHLSDREFDIIWSEAYDRGHSEGLHQVYGNFDNLYDFINKYIKVSHEI